MIDTPCIEVHLDGEMEAGNSCEVFQSSKRIKASSVIRECSLIGNLSAPGLVDRHLAFSDGHLSFEHFFVLFL